MLIMVALPVALAIVMLGLGLGLTAADFLRVARRPRIAVVALICQVLLLPAICFALVVAFRLPAALAVGMMLMAAAPGGTAANLLSHIFRGDVALNIALATVNSVLSLITLPFVVDWAIGYFGMPLGRIGAQPRTAVELFVIVLLPVLVGMVVRGRRPAWADRMERPVRIASLAILAVVLAGTITANWDLLSAEIGRLGGITVLFCLISLTVGFVVPRWFGARNQQAVATSFEIGLHNATLAVVVAQTVLGSVELSLAPAVYGMLMLPLGVIFGLMIRSRPALRRARVTA
jgi:BASS family bile acid:Na+ symporter